jgi:hypothetical protein
VCVCVGTPFFPTIFLPFLVSHLISLVFSPLSTKDDEEKIGKPSTDEGEETCHAPFSEGGRMKWGALSFSIFQKKSNEERIKPRRSKETVSSQRKG